MAALDTYRSTDRLVADQLRRAPLFAQLPNDRRECLAVLREGFVFELPAGVEIVSPGDPPALIVVTEGALCDTEGIRAWPAGSCLGIAEIMAARPFADCIHTAAPTLLYRLDATLLQSFRVSCPVIAQRLLDHVQARPKADSG